MRRLEQSNIDLVAAKENAERANLSKTRFLAAASHDVLQPLNAAHLSVSALADLQTSEEGRKLVRQVERSLETMDDLLRTLLDISKLDAGVVQPEVGGSPAGAAVSRRSAIGFPADGRQERPEAAVPADRQFVARRDRTLLRRILQNIVSNALRYTRDGGVLVGVRRAAACRAHRRRRTPAAAYPTTSARAVFEEFHRGPITADTDSVGRRAGLGLSIVRRMVDALGHRIVFLSVVGRGTVFRSSPGRARRPMSRPARWRPNRSGRAATACSAPRCCWSRTTLQVLEAMRRCSSAGNATVRAGGFDRGGARRARRYRRGFPTSSSPTSIWTDGDLGTKRRSERAPIWTRECAGPDRHGGRVGRDAASREGGGIELMLKPVKPAQLRALLAHLLA